MSRLPALNGRDVIRALQKGGFVVVRIKGSHHFMIHRGDKTRMTNVPVHASADLPRGTLRDIIKQAGLTVDEFLDRLWRPLATSIARPRLRRLGRQARVDTRATSPRA